ncbi:MAG: DUF4281 domain-containing protein [Verrucomicrobiae bacterium]|nr:DUF4281 domain-containing protein [Verrucomicrobiae bacterium]
MPVWIVEFFGEAKLNQLFWIITGSTAPFWILMIFFGRVRWVKQLCHPWLIPPLLGALYIYTVYLVFTITRSPEVPEATMRGVRAFWMHPFLFLSLWAHRMILDLFCGMMLNRTQEGEGPTGKFSLLLIWIFGPIGLMVFALRYWMNYQDRFTRKSRR